MSRRDLATASGVGVALKASDDPDAVLDVPTASATAWLLQAQPPHRVDDGDDDDDASFTESFGSGFPPPTKLIAFPAASSKLTV